MQTNQLTKQPVPVMTPLTVTHCLAYMHYYTPKWLPRGCCIAPKHLRFLALRIDQPQPKMRSLKNHPALAAHLALLVASGYVKYDCQSWQLTLTAYKWLNQPFEDQLPALLTQIEQPQWQAAFTHLTQREALSYAAYVQQALKQQTKSWLQPSQEAVRWGKQKMSDHWQLILPERLSPWLLFHLIQLGSWEPIGKIVCTPQNFAASPARHYGYDRIRWLLETATEDSAYHWLGLRILSGLQTFLPGKVNPLPPHAQMHNLEQQMSPSHVTELETHAQHILSELTMVIQGRDAFFPAYNEVPANSR